jgi:DNA (cytosine-5)-methyltransferase 1
MTASGPIPVVDLFAGPGGLGEGFSARVNSKHESRFRVALSIEKDARAHSTLLLRSFVRLFGSRLPAEYYSCLQDTDRCWDARLAELFKSYPTEASLARNEAWQAELGKVGHSEVYQRIRAALGDSDLWVLLGGPPCQAYSLAGRSRNKGRSDYIPHQDGRQYLYIEYLQVIAEHRPAIFVMENVKGLLSATVNNKRIFSRILEDLAQPLSAMTREGRAVHSSRAGRPEPLYEIYSLAYPAPEGGGAVAEFVVPMEKHGVPQARHRLILLGIRNDLLGSARPGILPICAAVPAKAVLSGLPRLRSGLSKESDTVDAWLTRIRESEKRRWLRSTERCAEYQTYDEILRSIDALRTPRKGRGGEFVSCDVNVEYRPDWFLDGRLNGVLNHSTRGHIVKDLHRYLYCSCFGKIHGRSPVLSEFPPDLLPDHQNVQEALNGSMFADRFRVQLADRPSTTITSHISKDGHYYIHYDPTQCRSLTVREAARLQTFPDNYFFCGPRTAQYSQVGNAVPPLLARNIADIVHSFLKDSGAVRD